MNLHHTIDGVIEFSVFKSSWYKQKMGESPFFVIRCILLFYNFMNHPLILYAYAQDENSWVEF